MKSLYEAIDDLQAAYYAKDREMAAAVAEVDRKFAPILLECHRAYKQARESKRDQVAD